MRTGGYPYFRKPQFDVVVIDEPMNLWKGFMLVCMTVWPDGWEWLNDTGKCWCPEVAYATGEICRYGYLRWTHGFWMFPADFPLSQSIETLMEISGTLWKVWAVAGSKNRGFQNQFLFFCLSELPWEHRQNRLWSLSQTCKSFQANVGRLHMEVSWNRATPSPHPLLDDIFPTKNHPSGGTPMTVETPKYSHYEPSLTI